MAMPWNLRMEWGWRSYLLFEKRSDSVIDRIRDLANQSLGEIRPFDCMHFGRTVVNCPLI